jgi:high-affinity iron transporter
LSNAAVLLAAVLMLGWHNVWMARHGRVIAAEARALGEAVAGGRRPMAALAIVVGLAVLREGAEVVLFLYGIAVSAKESAIALASGSALGLLFGAGTAALMYLGLVRVPARHLFAVTSWLIALLAAGMAAQAAGFLQASGHVAALADPVWDTSSILSENSIVGRVLQTLIGYTDRPSALQLLLYAATLATIFALMRRFAPPHGSRPRAVA